MDHQECPKCAKSAVPKLWHYRPFMGRLRHLKTQHLCPFCGCCMYETGGEITFFGKLILVCFVPLLVIVALQDYLRKFGNVGSYIFTALSVTFAAGVVLWLGHTAYKSIRNLIGR